MIGLNDLTTSNTTSNHRLITANVQPVRCSPKNSHDQQTPSNNCNTHQPSATRANPRMASHTIQAETAINTYRTAQTEAKTIGDGFQLGCCMA